MHVIVRVRRNPPDWDPPLTLRPALGEKHFTVDEGSEVEIKWSDESVSRSSSENTYELPIKHETRGLTFNSVHTFVEIVPDPDA